MFKDSAGKNPQTIIFKMFFFSCFGSNFMKKQPIETLNTRNV